jgi:hypothetical protein
LLSFWTHGTKQRLWRKCPSLPSCRRYIPLVSQLDCLTSYASWNALGRMPFTMEWCAHLQKQVQVYRPLSNIVQLHVQAVEIMSKRSLDQTQLNTLMGEMMAYKSGTAPFNVGCLPSETLSVRNWWLSLANTQASAPGKYLVTLAVLLYSIVPHAAVTERTFSTVKWINAPRRSNQTVGSLNRLTKVRTVLHMLLGPPR